MSAAPNEIVTAAIDAVASGRDLSADEASGVLAEIMSDAVSDVQIAGFLIALRTKGETAEELAGLARTMRALAIAVDVGERKLLDTAGTGGGTRTFNVSTTAALIAAGAGCAVAKHGNRSATGPCGSADLLEALGARIDLDAASVVRCIEETGVGFMFAPAHHHATRSVAPVRRALAVRTIFNFLGPLTNPAGARHQLIGVSDQRYLETIAGALAQLGVERALVVAGEDSLDEVSTTAPTRIFEVNGDEITNYTIEPGDLGLEASNGGAVAVGGTPEENAALTRAVLAGEGGPARDLALANAGAAIHAAKAAANLPEAVALAAEAVDSGRASETLERFVAATNELAA